MYVKYSTPIKQKNKSKLDIIDFDVCNFCRVSITCLFLFLNLNGCAKMAPPQGGPIDEMSPRVISSIPVNDALFVPNDSIIEVQFSETMDREITEQAIFLSPNDKMKMSWKGDKLRLYADLQLNTTYLLTVGAAARDLRGNVMGEPFQVAFSTGSQLNPGSLRGSVYRVDRSDRIPSTVEIFVYDLKYFSGQDSFAEPRYRTQCLVGEQYNFSRLALGEYRIIAFEDSNRNGSPDSKEWIAIPSYDVEVKDSLSYVSDLILVQRERSEVVVKKAVALHSRNLSLFLSRYVELANFSIDIKGLEVYGYFWSDGREHINVFTETQEEDQEYLIETLTYSSHEIIGEKFFRGNSKLDLNPPRWIGLNEKKIFTHSPLKLVFTEAMDEKLFSNVQLPYDEKRQYLGVWRWHSVNEIHFVPAHPWPVGEYVLKVNSEDWRSYSGQSLPDSILSIDFEVIPTPGSISGKITGYSRGCTVVLEAEREGLTWESMPDTVGRFSFEELPLGRYRVWTYMDENGDGEWSPGTLRPYAESEKRVNFKDFIDLDPGEHHGNILMDFSYEK